MKTLCAISLFISFMAICFAIIRTEPFLFVDNSFIGFILSVLSIGVTFSVGFQVIQTVGVVKKVDNETKENNLRISDIESRIPIIISEQIEKRIENYDHTVNALIQQIYTIMTYYDGNNYEEAFIGFMRALKEALKGNDKNCIAGITSYLEDVVCCINKHFNGKINITDDEKSEFIKLISQVNGEISIKLIKEISKFNTSNNYLSDFLSK